MREITRVFVYIGVCQVHPNLSVLRVRERVRIPQLHLRAIRTATWVIRSQRNKDGKKKRKVISPITRRGKTDRASRNSTGAKPGQGVEASATMRNSTDYHLAQRRSPPLEPPHAPPDVCAGPVRGLRLCSVIPRSSGG